MNANNLLIVSVTVIMMGPNKLLGLISCLSIATAVAAINMEIVNQWGFLDFDFPYDYDIINNYR